MLLPSLPSCPLPDRASCIRQLGTVLNLAADSCDLDDFACAAGSAAVAAWIWAAKAGVKVVTEVAEVKVASIVKN
jgi:hypothetical protein